MFFFSLIVFSHTNMENEMVKEAGKFHTSWKYAIEVSVDFTRELMLGRSFHMTIIQGGAPELANLVYNFHNYGLWLIYL